MGVLLVRNHTHFPSTQFITLTVKQIIHSISHDVFLGIIVSILINAIYTPYSSLGHQQRGIQVLGDCGS